MSHFLRTILPAFVALVFCIADVEAKKRKKKAPTDTFGFDGVVAFLPVLGGAAAFYAIWVFISNINAQEDEAHALKNKPQSTKSRKAALRKTQ